MKKYWIVWNRGKSEGVIFDEVDDAVFATTGVRTFVGHSSLAYDWRDNYDDLGDDAEIQEIEL